MAVPKKRHRDFDDEDDRPAAKKKRPSQEDSDDVAPPAKKRPRRDDDDGDEDDYRPRRKKRPSEESSPSKLLIGSLIGGALLLLILAGIGVFFMTRAPGGKETKDTPIAEKDRPSAPPDGTPKDKGPPATAPANLLAEPGVKLKIDAATRIKDIVFAEQASAIGVFFWTAGAEKRFELWNWKDGKRLANVALPKTDGTFLNVSPKGTRLVLGDQFNSTLQVVSLPEGNSLVKDFNPFNDVKTILPTKMFWCNFLDEDRLLILANSGRFDLWSLSQQKNIYTKYGIKGASPPGFAYFARAPQNFNLSPDRKLLAIQVGDAFEIIDAATGNSICKTESVGNKLKISIVQTVAFDRTGTLLAFKGSVTSPPNVQRQQDVVVVWETASGKKKWQHNISPDLQSLGPIAGLSPGRIAINGSNCFQSYIMTLKDGQYQRECKSPDQTTNYFARATPDGRLWYACRSGFTGPHYVLAVNVPENDILQNPTPAGQTFTLNLPVWGYGPSGISKLSAGK